MGHRETWRDVTALFVEYRRLTGDGIAELEQDGASWRLFNGPKSLAGWIYGAGPFCLALRSYCEGFEAGAQNVT